MGVPGGLQWPEVARWLRCFFFRLYLVTRKGQTMTEYALIIAAVALIFAYAAYETYGVGLNDLVTRLGAAMTG
jgi:Flp pilus assembly pilin Flp